MSIVPYIPISPMLNPYLDSISLGKLCNDTLSGHRVLVVAVVVPIRIFFQLESIPVVVLVVEACQLVPIATDVTVMNMLNMLVTILMTLLILSLVVVLIFS